MQKFSPVLLTLAMMVGATTVVAAPEYVTIAMEIDVAKPADEVWAKVGKYCDISEWLKLD